MQNIILVVHTFLFSLSHSATTCSNSVIPGPLTWTNAGTSTTGYIIQAGGTGSGKWGTVTTSGSQVTTNLGPRFYLADSCATAFSPTVFQKINPLGSTIKFTVDLATMGCSCDAAFYLVGMPASVAGGNGDYYCDANCVGGSCCTEMDLMEANVGAIQITAHRCTSPTSGCDGGGCVQNTNSIANGYGYGSQFTINSENAFTIAITFSGSSTTLTTITSVISQGSKSITLTHNTAVCGSGYLQGLVSAFQTGVVPVWSVWSGSMSWLDGSSTCGSVPCSSSGSSLVLSSLSVAGAGTVSAPPPPPPPSTTPTCGDSGCTINSYWVEFTPPTTFTGTPPSTASVLCGSTTYSCTWAYGIKYQCAPTSACSNPIPIFEGAQCPYPTPQADTADQSAMSVGGLSLSIPAIAGIAAGCVVLVVGLIVVIIVVKRRIPTEEYV